MLVEYYRGRYQVYWYKQNTRGAGIRSVGVNIVVRGQVSGLLVVSRVVVGQEHACRCKQSTTGVGNMTVRVSSVLLGQVRYLLVLT